MKAQTSGPVLDVRGLAVGYRQKTVLQNLNFTCERGQFVSLLGPNGAGKTTLLRTLSRHHAPISGEIFIMNQPLHKLPALDLARIMAVVLTEKITPPLFTVEEFVALGRYPHTDALGRLRETDREQVRSALAAVYASPLAARQFGDLSDGERQKVLLARALAQEPQLLLLDEPTIYLDLKHRLELMAILRELCHSQGITVLASLHDVDIAAKVSDRVALVKDGGIASFGPPELVLDSAAVARLYDMEQAVFDQDLGGLEIRGSRAGQPGAVVFVVGGQGTAAGVYRMLAKKGFAIATGVLAAHDLDCHVAQALGADNVFVEALANIDDASAARAQALLSASSFVVDSGFPLGPATAANLELVRHALWAEKTVLSLRPDATALWPNAGENLRPCADVATFLATLDELTGR